MIHLLRGNWYLVVAAAVVLGSLILLNRSVQKKKKREEQYAYRVKDQVLNEALKNNLGRRNAFNASSQAAPLEDELNEKHEDQIRKGQIVLKLTVTGAKTQNYVVNPEEHILVGSAEGMNDIVLKDKNIAQQQCDIFLHEHGVYIRNLNLNYSTILKRKGNQIRIEEKGVRILSRDQIILGNCKIQVMLMDYVGNIIPG
ncbi:MAG: FHA domain-containing protein [Lachnospiraceae bacterium]|nr:FHA domain-containing protein [Lachnospiraceae bacterium]